MLKEIKEKRKRDPRKMTHDEWVSDLLEKARLAKAREEERPEV